MGHIMRRMEAGQAAITVHELTRRFGASVAVNRLSFDVAPGAIIYFPVHTDGGMLYVGDCHATQGDGELSGVALEQRATVTLQVDLIKNWSFAWPRLETKDFIMTIGSARIGRAHV